MLPKHPLEIPEVTAHVTSYLCDKDLTSCVRVSKSWRDVFIPHRWRVVRKLHKWSYGLGSFSEFGPDAEAHYKHRHLVQDLYLQDLFHDGDVCIHPILRNLGIDFGRHSSWRLNGRVFDWDLTTVSPLLQRLSLTNANMGPQSCQRLSEHPHLRSLVLQRSDFMPNNVQVFWEACKNLESLSMEEVRFIGNRSLIPTDTVFARMRTLIMRDVRNLSHSQQVSMVLQCPILESFELRIYAFETRITIKHPIEKDRWSHLDNLSMPMLPQDEEWASVLDQFGNCFENITFLHLRSGSFGPQSLGAIRTYFRNLMDLRLTFSNSSVITDVLCSCPTLEILHVTEVSARDITERGPWACQGLRELEICICVQDTERDLQPLVFERLSTLVRLVRLDMSVDDDDKGGCGALEFRLDCGLEHLASLKQLKVLGFNYLPTNKYVQRLGTEDIEWMVDNWEKLEGIYGYLNSDWMADVQLRNILGNHGILHSTSGRDDRLAARDRISAP
ncbi:hypothetical protein BGX34_007059 [Mortierella sp. NVP85]|nr:hypothetical protein BGX34_007059 [Mortierella sp. NVP85]